MNDSTVLTRPETGADLDMMFSHEISPEYVLLYLPPFLYERIRDRIIKTGCWELLTVTDYDAGNPPPEDWTIIGPENTPVAQLAGWVAERVGHFVSLAKDTTRIKTARPFAREHTVTLYWVRRDT
jgi:hypothetical protein